MLALRGDLLRAGTVGEQPVVWVPDFERLLLGDLVDLEAARAADESEAEEGVAMATEQLLQLSRSAT